MATITGKRFQITDGASTPTNLFPYTVSEAVYGLSNTISNAISTALSALSLSTYAGTSAIGSSTQPVYYNGSALVATDLSTTYAPYNANGYLPLTGGTISNGNTSEPLSINSTGATVGMNYKLSGSNKVWVGHYYTMGAAIYNYASAKYLGVKDDGTPHFQGNTLWHSGNSNLSTVAWACLTLTASGNIQANAGVTTANGQTYGGLDAGGTRRTLLGIDSANNVSVAWGAAGAGYDTGICGNRILFRYGTSHTTGMIMDSSGRVGIGTSSPTQKLDLRGNFISVGTNAGYILYPGMASGEALRISTCNTSAVWQANAIFVLTNGKVGFGVSTPSERVHVSGNIVATGAITAGSASDARLKTNIQSLSAEAAKRIVMALNPVTFTWNEKATELYDQYKGDDLGMIAQEVEPYLPQAVGTIFESYKRLDYTKVISPLVKVAQDHESRIRQLEAENRELRKRLNMN